MIFNSNYLALFPIVLVFLVYKILTQALARFFLVPTLNWKDKILKVINYPKPIYLNVGWKRSSFRRRLITASVQPSFYTNYVNNKLKIQSVDSENEGNLFINKMKIRDPNDPQRKMIFGFFHPYANNGGGGEKVLWQAVSATLKEDPRNIVAIYTTNTDAEPLEILGKAENKFEIKNMDSKRIVFIYLRRFLACIDASYWKHLTLAGQLLGSAMLGVEAMFELSPDVWVDTMGLPGSYWLTSWVLKIPIIAYVHYPIIQQDMFNKLKFQQFSDLSAFRFTKGDVAQLLKFVYWNILWLIYVYLGSRVDVALTNSSWTFNHINKIWFATKNVDIVYPPCSTEHLSGAESSSELRENTLLYIAQFRPEKRHMLVLEEYSKFLKKFQKAKLQLLMLPRVVFLGSCRSAEDSTTLDTLREAVANEGLSEYVKFVVDCSYDELKQYLHSSKFGLNAMWNEHFGIGVVEYLSSGVVPIVHASAGPLLDIVCVEEPSKTWKNELGFFFKSKSDPDFKGIEEDGCLAFELDGVPCSYPTLENVLEKLFIESPEEVSDAALQEKRRLSENLMMEKFSNRQFDEKWINCTRVLAALEVHYREDRRDKVDVVY